MVGNWKDGVREPLQNRKPLRDDRRQCPTRYAAPRISVRTDQLRSNVNTARTRRLTSGEGVKLSFWNTWAHIDSTVRSLTPS